MQNSDGGLLFGQGRNINDYWSLLTRKPNSRFVLLYVPGWSNDFISKFALKDLRELSNAIDKAIKHLEAVEEKYSTGREEADLG